mgnify:FL=1
MKTILAVDLKKGKVVKAFAGFRLNYKPLIIDSIDFSDPCKLINFVVKEINLRTVYLADLDSINNLLPNMDTIEKILKKFPKINFLIDCGFNYPASINKFYSIFEKKKINNFNIILGTENLKNFNLNNFFLRKNIIISLDFNGYEKKWFYKIKSLKKQPELIFMFVKKVGGRGIDWRKLKGLITYYRKFNCIIAGGIKYSNQIRMLKNMGFTGVIISNLIHQKISRDLKSLDFNF